MNRTRKAFVVYVDLNPAPGTFHTQESAQNILGRILKEAIPFYNPTVSLAPLQLQPEQTAEVLHVSEDVGARLREYVNSTPIFKIETEEPELEAGIENE